MTRSVIVIGAGMGGLTAALRLARRGFQVRVVEARPEPGGLASGVRYGSLDFDAGPYILLDCPGLEWSFEKVGLNLDVEVPLLKIEDIYKVELQDGTAVCFYSSLDKTVAGFEKLWPGSGKRYKEFVCEMERISRGLRPMLTVSRPTVFGLIRNGGALYATFLLKSLGAVLARVNLPSAITEAVAIWTHVAGQTKAEAPSPMAFVPALMHSVGAYYPKGGIRRIPKALENAATTAGVAFQYSTKVTRIRVEGTKAIGVETDSGEFIPATAVLSDAAALATYLQLVDTPPAQAATLKKLPLQSPGVCAYLAVRGTTSPPYLTFKLGAHNGRCRLLIQPAVVDHDSAGGDWIPVRLLAPMSYSAAEELGPVGQLDYLDRLIAEGWWRRGFSDIQVLAKRNPAQWGTDYHLYANSMNPVMTAQFMRGGRVAHRSPHVRGLYLAGSSTHPGQWVSFCAISGILAADCILEDFA